MPGQLETEQILWYNKELLYCATIYSHTPVHFCVVLSLVLYIYQKRNLTLTLSQVELFVAPFHSFCLCSKNKQMICLTHSGTEPAVENKLPCSFSIFINIFFYN